MKTIQSVEPQVVNLANGWMREYGLDYKLEQESLNREIDEALKSYASKSGGGGGNRPDAKLMLTDSKMHKYPVLIEYKGYKDRLVKLVEGGGVDNRTSKNEINYKNVKDYAVNGAVHYATAVLHYTGYSEVIAIGMTGWIDELGKFQHEIGVWYVSKDNLGAGQSVGEYSDLSFLKEENFDEFIEKAKSLSLTAEELELIKERREREITASLVRLNNDIFKNEEGVSEKNRIYLVAATIIANIGVPGRVPPLESGDLHSYENENDRDGDIIMNKIRAFLSVKDIPEDKKKIILDTLSPAVTNDIINRPQDGESQLKRIFVKIVDDLGIYYKIGLSADFTGKLFNEMYSWLGFTTDKFNDVVLTPSYVCKLLAKLARVDRDSYVWDFATGSAGLLVAAMNEMIADARENIKSPDELRKKEMHIKGRQLLGIEILPEIYMLAVINMILMGDGSSHILQEDSLLNFDGKYSVENQDRKFPATAFVLNPPYSSKGNGMVFVEKALSMMEKGYAAIIIQGSAGSGKAKDFNVRILKHNTLLASIKMPIDLFVGKSSVQTYIYVFHVGEPHHRDCVVRFIDFSNDGYTRTNRKKSSCNLRDTDNASARYQEIVDLVRFGKGKLRLFTEKEYYEGTIEPFRGDDWNQTAPVDTKPTLSDFKKTVADYLAWEVSELLKRQSVEEDCLGK